MEKKTVFKGVATALITPLDANGINYEKFGALIDDQVARGINALVICGTTGEASTLNDKDHIGAIAYAVERVGGKVPVIAGAGSNDSEHGLALARESCKVGADALLVVTPYYNKTSQRGLIKLYNDVADASDKPIILYNVPSRTGVNIEPATYAALAEHENIVGIKEANGNLEKIVETMSLVGDKLDLYSGNDDQVVPLMSLGGKGVISVVSNVLPEKMVAMCDKYFAGDVKGAAEMQFHLHKITKAMFSDVNPIPVKAAMAALGYCENFVRGPLVPMEGEPYEKMLAVMREYGLNV
ncbi:MAG: 4-hydroxy-tetrahydrodipicolinate synthase [Clostridia bacterium]|nr:4-hydroxy-tetrahydrodipicolinate synthase [Clostridia bacterium]